MAADWEMLLDISKWGASHHYSVGTLLPTKNSFTFNSANTLVEKQILALLRSRAPGAITQVDTDAERASVRPIPYAAF